MKLLKKIFEYLVLFTIGGVVYQSIEIIWDGQTHWTMFFCGGIALTLIGLMNENLSWDMPILLQMLLGCVLITAMELLVGTIFNADLQLWNYSDLFLNYKGQICLLFSFFWFILSGVAIVLDDYLRYWLFDEEKPHYKL